MPHRDGSSDPANRRAFRRRSVLLSGHLYHGKRVEPCIVANVSASGAKLRFERPVPIEVAATLHCDRLGAMPGEVVWHGGSVVGFRFSAEPALVREILEDSFPRNAAVLGMD